MITVRNTNHAPWYVYPFLQYWGAIEDSRNGNVLAMREPLVIQYTHPHEKVNFCEIRDANPFFHFFETMWFLEGTPDTEFICHFLPRMKDFSDDGYRFHGHYGHRILHHFGLGSQLKQVIHMLRTDPKTRRAVVSIWDADYDLARTSKDIPCNDLLMFRVVDGALDMTVCNRSNDAVLGGVTGANITNLFVFQEYVAGMMPIPTGRTFVMSNNLHVYWDHPKTAPLWRKYVKRNTSHEALRKLIYDPYIETTVKPMELVKDPVTFDMELLDAMRIFRYSLKNREWFLEQLEKDPMEFVDYTNPIFSHVGMPMLKTFILHKFGQREEAIAATENIHSTDWRQACIEWLERRYDKKEWDTTRYQK